MEIGDVVVRKSYDKDVTFKVIDIKDENGKKIYILKGINIRIIADSEKDDLEEVRDDYYGEQDKILNSRVNRSIKNAIASRSMDERKGNSKENKVVKNQKDTSCKELFFGRPGKILHVDGDKDYMDTCLKVYKQLSLDAVGVSIKEEEQPYKIVDLVKEIKPDIVVLTGHDSVIKNTRNYLDLDNYRNSKFYRDAVKALRDYNSSYDELVIFAGACQSCYECMLDAGANFASSPNRVLIHCLDPVFVCEKIAYTKINEVVSIQDVIENTITGIRGIGGLQTRGKYREGYPKSSYLL
ncbi:MULTISPECIES: sporulation peptidase YabG [Clostridium]|uniref:Sporulation peptidase YabG n=1 Tax=Clostridium nitritogenes TaxID=83340 RepID=A0ABN1LSL7_9CLOT|nr:sporulation peptidase YabG [Clostridium baratii]AQM60708.1 sporulation peptidase YabG [Clostridium baratii]KJU73116.1 peptidase [Clostridium baratii]MBT9831713.1 sporulation peptidase YabG [Clostridium baratii]STB00681.1 sporulation peptidase YabG [Clostridium baratii]